MDFGIQIPNNCLEPDITEVNHTSISAHSVSHPIPSPFKCLMPSCKTQVETRQENNLHHNPSENHNARMLSWQQPCEQPGNVRQDRHPAASDQTDCCGWILVSKISFQNYFFTQLQTVVQIPTLVLKTPTWGLLDSYGIS